MTESKQVSERVMSTQDGGARMTPAPDLPARDPRRDPRPGDVLRKNGRSTLTVINNFGSYQFDGVGADVPPMPQWNEPWLPGFRKWAKDTEVIHAEN